MPSQPMLEVEQKFSLMNRTKAELEDRLHREGYSLVADTEMTDWYFDSSRYTLMQQDCWLRYREKNGEGKWELKKGEVGQRLGIRSTVYEEIEGQEAMDTAYSLAGDATLLENNFEAEGHERIAPVSPKGFALLARIFTQRSTWKRQGRKDAMDLCIDLDTTDYGYAVGEVEAMAKDPLEVAEARVLIQDLIDRLTGGPGEASEYPIEGKLEYYLRTRRPDIYYYGVECGVIVRRRETD